MSAPEEPFVVSLRSPFTGLGLIPLVLLVLAHRGDPPCPIVVQGRPLSMPRPGDYQRCIGL
jgi:hypothetical protein